MWNKKLNFILHVHPSYAPTYEKVQGKEDGTMSASASDIDWIFCFRRKKYVFLERKAFCLRKNIDLIKTKVARQKVHSKVQTFGIYRSLD